MIKRLQIYPGGDINEKQKKQTNKQNKTSCDIS